MDSVIEQRPNDWRLHVARGLTLAGLEHRAAALSEAAWLQQSDVYRDDALYGPLAAEGRARILAHAEETNPLDEIERLLSGPSWLSVQALRLDPSWDPIGDHPRFQKLLNSYPAG